MREHMAQTAGRLMLPIGVGLVLGLIGPFGTFDLLPTIPRMAYWLAVVSVNWLLTDAIVRRVDWLVSHRMPVPRLLLPLLGAAVASVPATAVVATANGLSGIGWPSDVILLFGQVLILLTAICLPVYTWEDLQERLGPANGLATSTADRADEHNETDEAAQASVERSGISLFTARLKEPIRGHLLCLEMQDHYLVVHSTGGTEMILCRMEDAARELEGIGYRVHRSWWVAKGAVTAVERDGQRMLLRLADDRLVPVGRSYRPNVRAAGWM